MNLSVIIPAYNDLPGVLTALNTLQTYQALGSTVEYIVADDAGDVDMIGLIPRMVATTIRQMKNRGFAGNCNDGAGAAHGDILFFVNQDIIADYALSLKWNEQIVAAFDDPQVGIVAPLLHFPDGAVQSCGGEFDAACQPYHRFLGARDASHPAIAEPRDLEWATGAALAFRRECWLDIGGFDATFRMYWEDVDACLRAREKGWRIRYAPDVRFIHKVGSTGGSPHFIAGARLFKQRWVDTGKVKPGQMRPTQRWW